MQTSIDTTVGALLDGDPIAGDAVPDRDPIALPAGQQELLISPGAAFVVDGVQLAGPLAAELPSAATHSRRTPGAGARTTARCDVPRRPTSRVLVVPESINPGWTARTGDGAALTPVTVNGWQQGWVVPAGTSGTVTLTFALQRRLPRRPGRRAGAAAAAGAAGAACPRAARRRAPTRRGRGGPARSRRARRRWPPAP